MSSGTGFDQSSSNSGMIGGSGTLGYIPKFSPDGNSIANSKLFDSGSGIGLGTTTPTAQFQVLDSTSGLIVGNNTGTAITNTAAFGLGSTYGVIGFKNATDVNSNSNWLWDAREDNGAGLIQVWRSGVVYGNISAKAGSTSPRFSLKNDAGVYSFIVAADTGQINTAIVQVGNSGLVMGDWYIDTAANITANADKFIAVKS